MGLIDRIKCDLGNEYLVWKFPSEEVTLGAQLIVNESQAAFLYKNGRLLDQLGAGRHSLISSNFPVLAQFVSLPFGKQTPFSMEVWFVNLLERRDLRWGTPQPISVLDTVLGFPLSIRGFGSWGVKVVNPQALILKLIGTESVASHALIDDYFSSMALEIISSAFARYFSADGGGYLSMMSHLPRFSSELGKSLSHALEPYGLAVTNFNIESLSIPDSEKKIIQDVFTKKMEVQQLSSLQPTDSYRTVKVLEILNTAASQDGGAFATFAAGGMGMGAGLAVGHEMAAQIVPATGNDNLAVKLRQLKTWADEGLISEHEYSLKKAALLEQF